MVKSSLEAALSAVKADVLDWSKCIMGCIISSRTEQRA